MKWVKVTRPDGAVQYATKVDEYYYLNGYGFSIVSFDGKVEEIDGEPPLNYRQTLVGFSHTERPYKAIIDTDRVWNGWLKPWIHKSEIKRLVRDMNKDNDFEKWTLKSDGSLEVSSLEYADQEPDVYEPETHEYDGETYYYFGGGYTWEECN